MVPVIVVSAAILAAVLIYVAEIRPDHRLNDTQDVPYGPYALCIVPHSFSTDEVAREGSTKLFLVVDIDIGAGGPSRPFSLSKAMIAHARLLGPQDLVVPASPEQAQLYRTWQRALASGPDDAMGSPSPVPRDQLLKPSTPNDARSLDASYRVYFEIPQADDYDFVWTAGGERYVWDLSSASEWELSD